jgi:hypothetical protein
MSLLRHRYTRLPLCVAFAALSLLLVACGKEIGRIALHDEGQGETVVQATAGKKLALWTALDVKYTGHLAARYDVELLQDGAVVGKALCDPFDVNVKTGSIEKNIGDDHSISWNGKMKCDLTPTKTGPATVRAKLSFAQRPATLSIRDISLAVRE